MLILSQRLSGQFGFIPTSFYLLKLSEVVSADEQSRACSSIPELIKALRSIHKQYIVLLLPL